MSIYLNVGMPHFGVAKCAKMTDADLEKVLATSDIIRNRLKIFSVRKNALAFLTIQKKFGSFDAYIWRFVGGQVGHTT